MDDFFLRGLFFAVADILIDCTCEQHGFLRNIANLAPQLFLCHLPHIDSIYTHCTFADIVESWNHAEQSGFA
ncbi:hypothetical protein D3C75_1161240 [compost metagenome]